MAGLSIGKLSKATGVPIDTIRFYEKSGLLHAQRRPSGFREYRDEDVQRLLFIRGVRALGLSLEDIIQLLSLDDAADPHEQSASVESYIAAFDRKIDELRAWRNALLEWQTQTDAPASARGSIIRWIVDRTRSSANPCDTDCTCTDPRNC